MYVYYQAGDNFAIANYHLSRHEYIIVFDSKLMFYYLKIRHNITVSLSTAITMNMGSQGLLLSSTKL